MRTGAAAGHRGYFHETFAVSEAVTNGLFHGRPPVRLRLWTDADRIVATITDHGPGPTNPFVGLLPAANSSSAGLGLWMTHQMCSQVTLGRAADGVTLRLTAGAPYLWVNGGPRTGSLR